MNKFELDAAKKKLEIAEAEHIINLLNKLYRETATPDDIKEIQKNYQIDKLFHKNARYSEKSQIVELLTKFIDGVATEKELSEITNNKTINKILTNPIYDDAKHIIFLLTKWMDGTSSKDEDAKIFKNETINKLLNIYKVDDAITYCRKEIAKDIVATLKREIAGDFIYWLRRAIVAYDTKVSWQPLFDFALEPDTGYEPKYKQEKNAEIADAMVCMNSLREYMAETSPDKKAKLLAFYERIYPDYAFSQHNMSPEELYRRIEKAIKLNAYRPKNLPFLDFIFSDDLDFIGGDFDTFNLDLSLAQKNNEDPAKIRDKFNKATENRLITSIEESSFWADCLDRQRDLKKYTNFSRPNIQAYQMLLDELVKNFCDFYHISRDAVQVTVSNDPKKYTSEQDLGIHHPVYMIPRTVAQTMTDEDKKVFNAYESLFPGAKRQSRIYINLEKIAQYKQTNEQINKTLFDLVVGTFAHEMAHALDWLMPRLGPLGPQVTLADNKTYTSKDTDAYLSSATELHAFHIEKELLRELKKRDMQ